MGKSGAGHSVNGMDLVDTFEKWRRHQAWAVDRRKDWFSAYPLRGMGRRADGRFQFGYEIGGYGTVIGHCCHHSHRSREAAEDCGERFLAGKPPQWLW